MRLSVPLSDQVPSIAGVIVGLHDYMLAVDVTNNYQFINRVRLCYYILIKFKVNRYFQILCFEFRCEIYENSMKFHTKPYLTLKKEVQF